MDIELFEEMKNNRSNILLFFIVDNQDVYFLDVRKHPKGAGFITLEVLSIVYNNRWMEKIGARKMEGIIDLQPKIDSNEEIIICLSLVMKSIRWDGVCQVKDIRWIIV